MRLAQLGELVGGKLQIVDHQMPVLNRIAHVVDHPLAKQLGARFIEFAAQLGKAVRLGHAHAKNRLAKIRQEKLQHSLCRDAENPARVTFIAQNCVRFLDLQAAFGLGHFHEQQALVREVAVQGGFRYARCLGDRIDAAPFIAISHENSTRAFQHLIELTTLFDRRHIVHDFSAPFLSKYTPQPQVHKHNGADCQGAEPISACCPGLVEQVPAVMRAVRQRKAEKSNKAD